MELTPYASWEAVPAVLLAIVFVGLAVFLLATVRRSVAMSAFAVYLVMEGLSVAVTPLADHGTVAVEIQQAVAIELTLLLLSLPALVTFLVHYPAPRATRAMRLALIGASASLAAACILYTALVGLPVTVGGVGDDMTITSYAWTYGPVALPLALTAVVAFVLSGDLRAQRDADKKRSIWLVVLGFSLYPVYRGIRAAFILGDEATSTIDGIVWSRITEGTIMLLVPLALVAWSRLVRHRASKGAPWGLLLLYAATIGLGIGTGLQLVSRTVTIGAIEIVLPVVVTYALVRHSLFDFDGKVRWTVSKGLVAGLILLVFFVGSQLLQSVTDNGQLGGAVLAGLALFAINPIQRVADRMASVAVPTVGTAAQERSAADGGRPDASHEDTYRTALRKFLADGDLSRDEERHLARLTGSLGIDPVRAFDLREQVQGELEAAPRRTGKRPRP